MATNQPTNPIDEEGWKKKERKRPSFLFLLLGFCGRGSAQKVVVPSLEAYCK